MGQFMTVLNIFQAQVESVSKQYSNTGVNSLLYLMYSGLWCIPFHLFYSS